MNREEPGAGKPRKSGDARETAKSYLLLAAAIAFEVIATTNLKLSDGFTQLLPGIIVVVGYGLSIGLVTLVLQRLPLGLAYGIWGGAGTIATAIIGIVLWDDPFTAGMAVGIACVIAGIALLSKGTEELEAAQAAGAAGPDGSGSGNVQGR